MTGLLFSCGSAFFFTLYFTTAELTDPCNVSYAIINNGEKRSSAYEIRIGTDVAINDEGLKQGWYRVISESGTDMPTKAPDTFRCGTSYPIWLNGKMPSANQEVTGKVCTRTFTSLCDESWNIDIKNCTSINTYYYVYNLTPSRRHNSAYCFGTRRVKCPAGQTSEDGFYPGCFWTGVDPKVQSGLTDDVEPLVVRFECYFTWDSSFKYDVRWIINDQFVIEHENKSTRREVYLLPKHWVGKHNMNMIVKCSVRLRNNTDGTVRGYYHESKVFQAGVFPEKFQYQVIESQSTLISYTFTVPAECSSAYKIKDCKHVLYVTQPKDNNAATDCSSNNVKQENIAFDINNSCGLAIPALKTENTRIQFNITGYINGQFEKNGIRTTNILVSSSPTADLASGAWDNITIPVIQVLVSDSDEKMKGRHCEVFNDPHFYTADRKYYDYHLAGEHIIYHNTQYKYQVNAMFTACGSATCNCGIAILSGKSRLVVRTCDKVSRQKEYIGPTLPYIEKRICDDQGMSINDSQNSGRTFVVTLPIGTEIIFRINQFVPLIDYIFIKPSVLDIENTEGLCGYVSSNNKNTDDDFRMRGETNATKNTQEFAKSWRVKDTNESLFQKKPPFKEDLKESALFCKCASQNGTGIENDYQLHCNLTKPIEICYSLKSQCTDGSRRKRSIYDSSHEERDKRSIDDTDDVVEFPPFEILPDVYDDSFVPETPKWHNSLSLEFAEAKCRDYFDRNFPVDVKLASGVSPEDYLESCIEDIKIFGDTRFMPITLSVMQTAAKAELIRNQSLSEQKTDDGLTLLDKLTSRLCLNNCSSNGQCKKGVCACKEQFGGEDCSEQKSTPPTNVSLPYGGLCNIRKRACKKTNVYGYFMPPDVYYKTRHFEIFKNTRSYTGTFTEPAKATIIHSFMVSCELSDLRQKRTNNSGIALAEGYEISVSNDNNSFGGVVNFLVYDEECFSCETVNVTCIYLDSCPTADPTDQSTVGTIDEHTLPGTTNNDNLTTVSESVDLASTGITGNAVNNSLLETTTKSFQMTTSASIDHTSQVMTGTESTFTNTTKKTYTTTNNASVEYTIAGMTGTVAYRTLPETTKETFTTTSSASIYRKTAAQHTSPERTSTSSSNITSENVDKTTEEMARSASQHRLPQITTKYTPLTTNANVDDKTAGMTGTTAKHALLETTTTFSLTTTNENVDKTTEGITRPATQNKLQEITTKSSPTTISANVDDTTAEMTGTTARHSLPEPTTKSSSTTSANIDDTTAGMVKSTTVERTFQETTQKSSSTTISASFGKTTVELTGTADQDTFSGSTTENYQTTAEQNGKEEKEKSNIVLLISLIVVAVLVIGTIGAILVRLCLRRNTNAYEVKKNSSNMENVHKDETKNGSTELGDSKTTEALGNFTNIINA